MSASAPAREEVQGLEATIEAIAERRGVIERSEGGIAASPTWWIRAREGFMPRCDPHWAAAMDALLTDPQAALPEG
jgi:hypothetical protein